MKPTEHEMTVAVDAAARHLYQNAPSTREIRPTFDELHPTTANLYREEVLGPVIAALAALPDRRLGLALELDDIETALHRWNTATYRAEHSLVLGTLERRVRDLAHRIREASE